MTDFYTSTEIKVSFVGKAAPQRVLALGFFDSVHLGHRKLLGFTRSLAAGSGYVPSVYTFDNDFFEALGVNEKLVFTLSERISVLEELGFAKENIVVGSPAKDVVKTTGEDFLNFLKEINVKAVVCGSDFRFGAGGALGTEQLKDWGALNDVPVFVVPLLTEWNRKISSRDIREYLELGEVVIANHFLGRRFFIRGVVEHDRGVGKSFGLPTVNISTDRRKALPGDGVYATSVIMPDGSRFKGVTNIGSRPTFGESHKAVETHILDFDGDLYGKTLTVEFTDRLRSIFKFDSKEELKAQILQDIERVRSTTDD